MTDQQYDPAQPENPNGAQQAYTGGAAQQPYNGYGQQGSTGYGQQSYSGYTQSSDGAYTPGYQQPQGYQQSPYQQAYQQPVAPAAPVPLYPMTETDRNLRLVAFIFCILSLVGSCWLIIPLAWMIPMSIVSWGIYKGTKANTVAFDVCTLIFVSLVAGILLLCSRKDR